MRQDPDFAEFAEAQTRRLLGLAYALTGNPHDAWDLLQETLVRVGVRWSRLRHEEPGAYARTVMTRLNIDRLRRLRREMPTFATADRAVPVVDESPIALWLAEALRGLTPRQRTALALRFVEDLDVATIADRMNCSLGTAKSHLSRGMAQLRQAAGTAADHDAHAHEEETSHGR